MTHSGISSRSQKNRARSSSLFLMELILAILFFSVASAVCVQFFVKSHLLNLDSNILTHSVNECSGVAEIITTADSLTDSLALLQNQYPDGKYTDLSFQIYYDEVFSACAEASAVYTLDAQVTHSDQMVNVLLGMYEAGQRPEDGQEAPIYQLEAKHHIARRTDAHER